MEEAILIMNQNVVFKDLSVIPSFTLKAPNSAHSVICAHFPLPSLLRNNDSTLKVLFEAIKPSGPWLYISSLPSKELEILKDHLNSSKPAAIKHFDPWITLVRNNVPGIYVICPH